LEFARRRLEEVEGELAHASSWEGVLTNVEETLRGSFSKEQHTGDWVVSVDLLQVPHNTQSTSIDIAQAG
jgi:hypothetical protein